LEIEFPFWRLVLEGQSERDLMNSSLDSILKLNQLLDMKRDFQSARDAFEDKKLEDMKKSMKGNR